MNTGEYPVNAMLAIGIPIQNISEKTKHNFLLLLSSGLVKKRDLSIFIEFYKDGLSHNELADMYHIHKSRVSAVLKQTKQMLKIYKTNIMFDSEYEDERIQLKLRVKYLEDTLRNSTSTNNKNIYTDRNIIPIRDLGFTYRVSNLLQRNKIRTLAELQMRSEEDLLQMKSIGKSTVSEIRTVLNNNGNALKA